MQALFEFLGKNPYLLLFFTVGLAVWIAGYIGLALSLGLLPSAWNPFRRAAAEVT